MCSTLSTAIGRVTVVHNTIRGSKEHQSCQCHLTYSGIFTVDWYIVREVVLLSLVVLRRLHSTLGPISLPNFTVKLPYRLEVRYHNYMPKAAFTPPQFNQLLIEWNLD